MPTIPPSSNYMDTYLLPDSPWFPYIDFGWIIGGKGMEANLKALKAIGYNV